MRCSVLLVIGWLAWGCRSAPAPKSGAAWLAADPEPRALQLERQLRGFDVAMLETGHRYVELYWAGQDQNWDAAAYQLLKIRLAIENGLERRPQRATSARPFLAGQLVALEAAVAERSAAAFATRFRELTAACNDCHAAEAVPFFEIHPPATRVSPIRRVP
jgi:hypothetical protein